MDNFFGENGVFAELLTHFFDQIGNIYQQTKEKE